MKGIQYIVDETGKRTAVVIDLKTHAQLWEDFCDLALARSRKDEPLESLESVNQRIVSNKLSKG
jgi:hypothetical protein